MLQNLSPGAAEAIELRTNALRGKIEYALSGKADLIQLDEPSLRFLGNLYANRNTLQGLMRCASYMAGTLSAYESIQRAEGDFWISSLRKLQESCEAYLDAAPNEGVTASYGADSRDLAHLAYLIYSDAELLIRLITRYSADASPHAAPTGQ